MVGESIFYKIRIGKIYREGTYYIKIETCRVIKANKNFFNTSGIHFISFIKPLT
jgi:hypothetical protein